MSTMLAGLEVSNLGKSGLESFWQGWWEAKTVDEAERLIRAVPHLVNPSVSKWSNLLMQLECVLPILGSGPEIDDNAERLQSQAAIVAAKLLESEEAKNAAINCLLPPTIYLMIKIYLEWHPTTRREFWDCLDAIGKILDNILKNVLFSIYAERAKSHRFIDQGDHVRMQRPAYRRLVQFSILTKRFEPLTENPLPETTARLAAYARAAVKTAIGKQEIDTADQRIAVLALLNAKRYEDQSNTEVWNAIELVRILHQVSMFSESEDLYLRSIGR